MASRQVIASHSLAAPEYTWPVYLLDQTGKNITADTAAISLGTQTVAGIYAPGGNTVYGSGSVVVAADLTVTVPNFQPMQVTYPGVAVGALLYYRTGKLLVDVNCPVGDYWVYFGIVDTPETPVRRFGRVLVT